MLLKGTYKIDDKTYGVLAEHTNIKTEVLLVSNGTVISAFKTDETGSYSFINKLAKDIVQNINKGYKGCTSKNGVPMPFELGAMTQHEFTKTKIRYIVQLHKKQVCGIFADTDNMKLELVYDEAVKIPAIPYIKLTTVKKDIELSEDELDTIQTRSISEIALEKEDLTWLQKKKYFIVNDDDTAEKLFSFIDGYNGPVAYDTETTGLKINCFGQINSTYKKSLDKYNKEHPNDRIRADKLVGIIFCVEENTSYYFPCANRKFKNLYESGELREKLIDKYKARYIIGEGKDSDKPIAGYWRDTDRKDITSDVILMERVRHILETRHILAHNGSFEYKVGMQYCIDTNLKDDTMILHQVAYKYRNGAMKEPSNLKHLAKVELGMDQWELKDFFPNWKPDKEGLVRKKPGSKISLDNQIDFSYMDYDGTRIYAPADGDATLGLFKVFKTDLVKNKPEQEYIYNVEVLVACAVGYMEFYGHRIDESKILEARARTMLSKSMLVSQIRQSIDYSNENEIKAYNNAKDFIDKEKELNLDEDNRNNKLIELNKDIEDAIQANTEKQINLGSPAQVMDLFYNKLGMPVIGDKPSVAKKVVKALTKEKNIDGTAKYPVAILYSKYKNEETLLSKFFDNLIYFMYPGGFIFSSFGQVATDTGRMSCRQPNSQQYPKHITKIIIPRPDCVMVDADYSQIEYRVLTALAKNTELAKLFSDPDSDYHTLMAALMYNVEYSAVTPAMRSAAKSFNFGIPYGMGLGSLAILLTGRNTKQTRDEAAEKMEDYYRNQPRTRKFFDNVKEMAQVNGYTTTLFKRVRKYDFTDKDGKVNNAKRAASLRQAGNAVIQGCIHGKTMIYTREYGMVEIQSVVDKSLHVWDGEKWVFADICYSGKKVKSIVTFSNGQEFICSDIHKFAVISHRGSVRFVECRNLASKENSKNAHKIVVNEKLPVADSKYNSNWARDKYKAYASNANVVYLDKINDSFKIGVILGRAASDGSISNDKLHYSLRQIVAEHEMDVYDIIKEYMKPLNTKNTTIGVREGRTENIEQIVVNSKTLIGEISELDIKHQIHPKIFQDTEMLRGFLRGMFDGDGGISGKTISLTFGNQSDFEPFCRQIQKALLFFGIRSRYYKYDYRSKITIQTYDNERFLDIIGFISKDKQKKGEALRTKKDEHIFGKVLTVEKVEITDEYIDMYDVCNTEDGYYVADGLITHNTAADIFKIGVARNFSFIRRNDLFGKMMIINMIHDEQLIEVNVKQLNIKRILAEIGINMQFKIDGFPPLFIGAGVAGAWGKAKSKDCEIHPLLLDKITEEAKNLPLYNENSKEDTPEEVIKAFERLVYTFRENKVYDYVVNEENWCKVLHPAIAGLINLQFNYGRGDSAEGYVGPNGERYTDHEFLMLNLEDFLEKHGLLDKIKPSFFEANVNKTVDEDDDDYEDEDDEEVDDIDETMYEADKQFTLIDESDKQFGASIHDLINTFGVCMSKQNNICGINMKDMYYKKRDTLIDYISKFVVDKEDNGAMQVVFLNDSNVLKYTGIYVKGIDYDELEFVYKHSKPRDVSYAEADVENRSQAK